MNKIYFDAVKKLEICDVSGQKALEQINSEFQGAFVDVTAARLAKAEADKIAAQAIAEKEKLISDKMRAQAIGALQAEGKLDLSGNIVK